MSLLARRWPHLFGLTAIVAAGVFAFATDYNDLQRAADAEAFRSVLERRADGRYVGAAATDVVFAGLYPLTATAFASAHPRYRVVAAVLIATALFDEAENILVLRGALQPDDVTDGAVEWMRTLGDLKWTGLGVAVVVAGAIWLRGRRAATG